MVNPVGNYFKFQVLKVYTKIKLISFMRFENIDVQEYEPYVIISDI